MQTKQTKQIEVVTLKFPFDIKNIKPKMIRMNNVFSSNEEETFNVEFFSSVKYEVTQLLNRLKVGDRSNYNHSVYAWRSISKLKNGDTVVGKLKFHTSIDDRNKKFHINVDLLPGEEGTVVTPYKPKEITKTEDDDVIDVPQLRPRRGFVPIESEDEEPNEPCDVQLVLRGGCLSDASKSVFK